MPRPRGGFYTDLPSLAVKIDTILSLHMTVILTKSLTPQREVYINFLISNDLPKHPDNPPTPPSCL